MKTRSMRTKGDVEAAVCHVVTRFQRDVTGRGPRSISAMLQDDGVYILLAGVLTAAEQRFVALSPSPEGNAEMIRQMRDQLVRNARSELLEALGETLGTTPTTMLHDIAPQADEEMFMFKLPGKLVAVGRRA